MITFIVIFAIIAAIMIVLLFVDTSREASIERRKRIERKRQRFKYKYFEPLKDAVTRRVAPAKVDEVERKYKNAGLKVSFFTTKLLGLAFSVFLFFFCWKVLKNIYMGVVGLVAGWFLPDIIVGALANKRIEKIDEPIGIFMRMTCERYLAVESFQAAFLSTVPEMRQYPELYKELVYSVRALEVKQPITEVLYDLADRCENKYLWRYADLYRIASKQGTKESIQYTLMQVVKDHDRHMKDARLIKRQLNGITMESKFMLATVVGVAIYGIKTDPYYVEFFTTTDLGKFGAAGILAAWLICLWLVLYKLGAPIDKEDKK